MNIFFSNKERNPAGYHTGNKRYSCHTSRSQSYSWLEVPEQGPLVYTTNISSDCHMHIPVLVHSLWKQISHTLYFNQHETLQHETVWYLYRKFYMECVSNNPNCWLSRNHIPQVKAWGRLVHLSSKQGDALLSMDEFCITGHVITVWTCIHKNTITAHWNASDLFSHETQYNYSTAFYLVSTHSIWSG